MGALCKQAIPVAFVFALIHSLFCKADPVVTLKHGGQLQGITYQVGEKIVDHFVGVRYAKPPVGDLRFKKPEPADSWTGVELAQKGKGVCLQFSASSYLGDVKAEGEEDCLFLDVVVPGGISQSNSKKPVMVWIHGGGYMVGHRMQYIPAVLASHGDVIIVTINYRLGIFGFLSDRPGTGNFALWDQREAIIWVKDNIELFGGDPDSITIFGESAGAGSVVSQMMGQHNDGLFQRAIPESGTLYAPWGWYLSEKYRQDKMKELKEAMNCDADSIYDCYKGKTAQEVLESAPVMQFAYLFHPVPDNDFFPPEVEAETYELAKRFDLLAGFNGMEGNLFVGGMLAGHLAQTNKSLEGGCSKEDMQSFLEMICGMMISEESQELCAYFINKEYKIDGTEDDFERVIGYASFASEFFFNEDHIRLASSHSAGDKVTYTYQFVPYIIPPKDLRLWYVPDKLKTSADHGDELPYVFGTSEVTDDMVQPYSEYKDDTVLKSMYSIKESYLPADKKLEKQVMTLWTNFAKSGKPNEPVKVDSFPDWPEFTLEDKKLMMIDYDSQLIDVPYKERMERMRSILLQSRNRRVNGDSPTPQPAGEKVESHYEL